MCRDADLVQLREDELRDAVVEDALAPDGGALRCIESGRIVLEVLDERAGFRAFIQHLRLAFVNASAPAHVMNSNRLARMTGPGLSEDLSARMSNAASR